MGILREVMSHKLIFIETQVGRLFYWQLAQCGPGRPAARAGRNGLGAAAGARGARRAAARGDPRGRFDARLRLVLFAHALTLVATALNDTPLEHTHPFRPSLPPRT